MIDAVCIPISCLFQSSFTHTETKIEYIYEPKYRNNSIYDNIILGFCQSRYKGKCKWCKYERIVLFKKKRIALILFLMKIPNMPCFEFLNHFFVKCLRMSDD